MDNAEKVISLAGSVISIITFIHSHLTMAILVAIITAAIILCKKLHDLKDRNLDLKGKNLYLEERLREVQEFSEEYKKAKEKEMQHSVAIYDSRDLAYAEIRQRAKEKIILIGTGMSIMRESSLDDLKRQSKTVDIEIFMINPFFLKGKIELKKLLKGFFGNEQLTNEIYNSYNVIKRACEEVEKENRTTGHRMSLYVYDTMPTVGLTIIDPATENVEIILEPNLFQTKSSQPRFRLRKGITDPAIFDAVKSSYEKIRNISQNADKLDYIETKKNGQNSSSISRGEKSGKKRKKQDIKG